MLAVVLVTKVTWEIQKDGMIKKFDFYSKIIILSYLYFLKFITV